VEKVKKYKGALMVLGSLAGAAVMLSLAAQDSPARPAEAEHGLGEAIPAAGELRDLSLKYETRIGQLEKSSQEARQSLESIQKALAALAGALEEARRPAPPPAPAEAPKSEPGRLMSIELKSPVRPGMVVPAGSFGEATLLTGVFAPVSGEALPVLLKLDAVLVGPNRSRVPIQHSFMLGKAVGDANSSRAIIQLSTLSVVHPDGGSKEKSINGYVADSDGIQGLAGEYLWNGAKLVGLSALSGAATGASSALGQAQSTLLTGPGGAAREVTRDAGIFVGASGAARAAENIGKIIEDRMKEFVPAIHVGNLKRRVTVVFLQSVALDGPSSEREGEGDDFELGGFDR
jgi:hypothetical protein